MFSLEQIKNFIPNSEVIHVENPSTIKIENIITLHQDLPNSLSYAADKSYLKTALLSKATVLMIPKELKDQINRPALLVESVDFALIEILNKYFPMKVASGRRKEFLVVDPTSKIGKNTDLGNFVSIGTNSTIGENCIIEDGVKIGDNVKIGNDSIIGPNCVIFNGVIIGDRFLCFGNTTIGGDGFRYVEKNRVQFKIPQVGTVVIGNDVRIGSNSSIDRGGLDSTFIGDGTKIDNDVQIAHNVKIGKGCIVAGATAIAGSAVIEDYCKISGACAVGDHITLPSGTMLAGGSGIRNSPDKADIFAGWDWNLTFREFQKFRANIKHMLSLNMIVKRIKDLEEKIDKSKS
jgi:UDP-3-O-[3-hydroxymyristoyl] glucosamine N-acyltransferase